MEESAENESLPNSKSSLDRSCQESWEQLVKIATSNRAPLFLPFEVLLSMTEFILHQIQGIIDACLVEHDLNSDVKIIDIPQCLCPCLQLPSTELRVKVETPDKFQELFTHKISVHPSTSRLDYSIVEEKEEFWCQVKNCELNESFPNLSRLAEHFEECHCPIEKKRIPGRKSSAVIQKERQRNAKWILDSLTSVSVLCSGKYLNSSLDESDTTPDTTHMVKEEFSDFETTTWDGGDLNDDDNEDFIPNAKPVEPKTRSSSVKKSTTCDECGKTFKSRGLLKQHEQIHRKTLDHICSKCGKGFKSHRYLYFHKRKVHPVEEDEPDLKPEELARVVEAQLNKDVPIENMTMTSLGLRLLPQPVDCPECGKTFANINLCRQHQETHIKTNNHVCDSCGKAFKNYRYLMSHKRHVHSNILYKCEECNKEFRQAGTWREHRKLKHGQEPPLRFLCELCEKTFVSKASLRFHQAIVHKQNDLCEIFQCEQCPTQFVSKAKLNEHVKAIHQGAKVNCPEFECLKSFSHKDSLMKHLALAHNKGNRTVFHCDKCPSKFTSRSNLREHSLSKHLGFKHVCSHCGKEYSRKNKLNLHLNKGKCKAMVEPVATV